jgi:GLPGLI family protein
MKSKVSFLFIELLALMCLTAVGHAQKAEEHALLRVAYRVTGQLDSLNKETVLVDTLLLTVCQGKAYYHHPLFYRQDSLSYAMENMTIEEYSRMFGGRLKGGSAYKKNYLNNDVCVQLPGKSVVYASWGVSNIYYTETQLPRWSIEQEKEKVAGFECQKATTTWRGRRWVAWFTREVPLPFGPWKLRGLPGLIVKAESSGTAPYRFELVGIEKIDVPAKIFYSDASLERYMPSSFEEYTKLVYQKYLEPEKYYKTVLMSIGMQNVSFSGSYEAIEHFNPIEFLPERNGKKQ